MLEKSGRKELDLFRGDLQYHLYRLEKEGLLRTRRRGLYKFVFPSNISERSRTSS
jgi:predicted transcriptional regulator